MMRGIRLTTTRNSVQQSSPVHIDIISKYKLTLWSPRSTGITGIVQKIIAIK